MISGPFSYGVQKSQMFPITGILWSCADMANNPLGARGHGVKLKIFWVCCFYQKNLFCVGKTYLQYSALDKDSKAFCSLGHSS